MWSRIRAEDLQRAAVVVGNHYSIVPELLSWVMWLRSMGPLVLRLLGWYYVPQVRHEHDAAMSRIRLGISMCAADLRSASKSGQNNGAESLVKQTHSFGMFAGHD